MALRGLRPDTDAAALIEQVIGLGAPTLRERGISGAREYLEQSAAGNAPGPDVAMVEDVVIDTGVPVHVRVYRPAAEVPLPVVTYFHGGGWVVGSVNASDSFCRRLATITPCVVASVDYRLAPEHPFPAAIDDAVAAITWTVCQAEEIGGDPRRLVVLGDSAGGNVATVATRHIVGRGDVTIARQILAYPTIRTTQDGESHREHGGGWPLTSTDLAWFVELYLPEGTAPDHPDVCPLGADARGMPPTTILLAGCDPLLDEGVEYANHLAVAGVPVDLHLFSGQIHGFLTFPDEVLPRSAEARCLVANSVRCS